MDEGEDTVARYASTIDGPDIFISFSAGAISHVLGMQGNNTYST